jgi:hypothetical protein
VLRNHSFARSQVLFAFALVLGLAAPALADEEEGAATAAEPAAEEPEPAWPLNRISGSVQWDSTNAYFFRGILQERHGYIAQPWGELYYSLFQSEEGFIRDVSIGGGVWASFHTEDTNFTHAPHSLYETDWYPVVSVEFAHNLTLTGIYYFYTSPNGAFTTAQEFNLKLAWDDSETFGRFALQPWINLAIETNNTAFGDHEGQGLQMGIAPTLYTFFENETYPVTLSAPFELGLAINNYYEEEDGSEDTFGYFSFGLSASVPLAFMPVGEWTFTLTTKGMYLSPTLGEANLDRRLQPLVVASIGLAF